MEENQQIFRQPQAKITVRHNMLVLESLAGARTRCRRASARHRLTATLQRRATSSSAPGARPAHSVLSTHRSSCTARCTAAAAPAWCAGAASQT